MTHCIAASVVWRSASIFGSATLTTDSSTNAMVDPKTATTSTQVLSRRGQGVRDRVERMTSAAQGHVFNCIIYPEGAQCAARSRPLLRRAGRAADFNSLQVQAR